MTKRILFMLLASICAVAISAIAQEAEAINFMVIDGEAWLIETFSSVKIYHLDVETEERTDIEPVLALSYPDDPIEMTMDAGFYEFVVGMPHLPEDIVYFQFKIVENGEVFIIDLRDLDLPEELAIY